MWNYRRYLGRVGWLVAAALMVISPYMLYYGRYARNEALVVLFWPGLDLGCSEIPRNRRIPLPVLVDRRHCAPFHQ